IWRFSVPAPAEIKD
ncbi:hypothetical protein A2U01_0056087, partial [Trifolium medium]|nr:hypothetical protein [Trifolium medium]